MNTDRLNNEMFGSRKNYAKPLMFVAFVILALIVAMAMSVTPSHAMSTARFAACQNVLTIIATPHNPIGNNPHPACVPVGNSTQDTPKTHKTVDNTSTDNAPVLDLPVVTTPIQNDDPAPVENVVIDTPVQNEPTPVIKEDKPKCNNGEGNGSEGCSPAKSDNANNDENNTTPKEDKSHN